MGMLRLDALPGRLAGTPGLQGRSLAAAAPQHGSQLLCSSMYVVKK